jgi:hypothetical protein
MTGLLSALWFLTAASLRRLIRRPMVRRAMIWPGLLSAGSLLLAVSLAAMLRVPPQVATTDPALTAALITSGLEVTADPDPPTAVSSGRAVRAAWREPDGTIILEIDARRTVVGGQADDLAAEAALRDTAGASWRLSPTVLPARNSDFTRSVGWMAALIGVLFTLYGALVGLGALASDRSEGVLEPELALPLPSWIHPTARLLAASVVLSASLGGTLVVMDALVGVDAVGGWWLHGSASAVAAAGIGIASYPPALSGSGGFSGPLSRALTACTGLLGLGAAYPALGAWLPVAALGALASGHDPHVTAIIGAIVPGILGAWRFSRGLRA